MPASAQVNLLRVSMSDSGLRTAATTKAGMNEIRMLLPRTGPRSAHALVVQRLTAVIKYETYLEAVIAGKTSQYDIPSIGGPAVTADSVDAPAAVVQMRPGRYIIYCAERDADGTLHAAHNEAALVNAVLPFGFGIEVPPKPDAVVRLRENDIVLPASMRAGGRTLQVENRAAGARRVFVGKLREGRSIADVREWDRTRKGDRPFDYVTATSAISPGRTVYLGRGYPPGEYFVAAYGPRYGKGELAGATIKPLKVSE